MRELWVCVLGLSACGPEPGIPPESWMLDVFSTERAGLTVECRTGEIDRYEFFEDGRAELTHVHHYDQQDVYELAWDVLDASSILIPIDVSLVDTKHSNREYAIRRSEGISGPGYLFERTEDGRGVRIYASEVCVSRVECYSDPPRPECEGHHTGFLCDTFECP